ncbi:unnamed protein product [Amoebophrya sp. A120]|nr:unnamed protein product [Amoebophrya sp. A120]|eukprot:GSA120T00007911001.1
MVEILDGAGPESSCNNAGSSTTLSLSQAAGAFSRKNMQNEDVENLHHTTAAAPASPSVLPTPAAGLSAIVPGRYDALLIDQFGVLHDGKTIFPGVANCLEQLRRGSTSTPETKLVLLSNSTKRTAATKARLQKKMPEIDSDKFHDMVTSGELCWHFFHDQVKPEWKKAIVFDVADGYLPEFMKGLEGKLEFVEKVEDADFVLVIGLGGVHVESKKTKTTTAERKISDGEQQQEAAATTTPATSSTTYEVKQKLTFPFNHSGDASLESLDKKMESLLLEQEDERSPSISGRSTTSSTVREEIGMVNGILQQAKERNLPLVCVNPDLISAPRKDKTFDLVGGFLARRYEKKFGGTVLYFGKPHDNMYNFALKNVLEKQFGITKKAKIAMVGDSLLHDVTGANNAGIDSIWLVGGVHYEELGLTTVGPQEDGEGGSGFCSLFRSEEKKGLVSKLMKDFNATPTWLVPGFVW